jgi:hypothetical protein
MPERVLLRLQRLGVCRDDWMTSGERHHRKDTRYGFVRVHLIKGRLSAEQKERLGAG